MSSFKTDNISIGGAALVAAATILLVASGTAQKAVSQAPTGLDYSQVGRFDRDGQSIRTGGADFRAIFDGAGLQFTPALGQGAPRTFPVRFALSTIHRGNELVLDATGARSQPTVDGHRVDYDRGRDVTERYDVRSRGVKQSFVFEELPGGSGDLVVRCCVETDLEAQPTGWAEAVELLAGSHGGVTIDGVLGIDAMGQNAPGSLRWDGEHLDLVLPGSFVDGAQLPLILDPMIATSRMVGTSGNDDNNADAAWLESAGVYLVVWERAFSTSDIEIRARLRDEDNNALTGWFAITNGNNLLNRNPSVAAVRSPNLFAVCWQQSSSLLGPCDLWGTVVDSSANVITPSRLTGVSPSNASTPDNEIRPDVVSVPNAGVGGTVIVYENEGVGIEAAPGAADRSQRTRS